MSLYLIHILKALLTSQVLKYHVILIESLDSATRNRVCQVLASQPYLNCCHMIEMYILGFLMHVAKTGLASTPLCNRVKSLNHSYHSILNDL